MRSVWAASVCDRSLAEQVVQLDSSLPALLRQSRVLDIDGTELVVSSWTR